MKIQPVKTENSNKNKSSKRAAEGTKWILDILFFLGIIVTVTTPFSLKRLEGCLPELEENYIFFVILYFILGTLSVMLLRELRKIFQTVLDNDCFVMQNVISLKKMSVFSFLIALFSVVRNVLFLTIANMIVILVFMIAGLFSRVLAAVFEEAVCYKQENDLTI